jgi:hypothetical protein
VAATGGTIVPSDVAPKPVLISVVAMDIMPCGSDCLLTGRGELAEAPTKFTVVATRNVGADGADIVVGKTGSPIDDMVVHIPPGAMEVMDHISLGYSTRPVQVRGRRGRCLAGSQDPMVQAARVNRGTLSFFSASQSRCALPH